MEMESTHPNHPRGIEKPNESPKKWEKPCVVSHFGGGGEEGEKVQLFCLVSCDSCDFWVISSEKSEWVTCLCFW